MATLNLKNPSSRFDVAGNRPCFYAIVRDMRDNGGELVPSDHWNWNLGEGGKAHSRYTDELYEKNYSQLKTMLDPWVGVVGMQDITEESVAKYEGFLRPIDNLKLLPADILAHGRLNGWKETDLGSVLDINLISTFSEGASKDRFFVCEVGGGYGRLAEVFFEQFSNKVHYVMIDAVPGSLMYAYYYLKSQFPDLNIGSFFAGDDYNENYDCYILPSWHASILPDEVFDVCVNIESMQEMQQHHVDFYLKLFDRLTKNCGTVYLSNARDYIFKGGWNIPLHWETIYMNNTPRSWSADHPTHILRKTRKDHSLERCAHESAYNSQVVAWNNNQLIREQLLHIEDRDRICGELQKELDELRVVDIPVKQQGWLQRIKLIMRGNSL